MFKISKQLSIDKLITYIFVIIFTTACISKTEEKSDHLYTINTFTLNQTDPEGNKLFNLSSPNAVIDNINKKIGTTSTDIVLYNLNAPLYNIKANKSQITDNGNIVFLEGNVRLKKLDSQNISMQSNQVEWYSQDSKIIFIGNVRGLLNQTTIESTSATYNLNSERILFNEILDFNIISDNTTRKIFNVEASSAVWDGKLGTFEFFSDNQPVKSQVFILQ